MTRLTTKLMIAAAALVAAGAASAQTMQATIPFAFRAGGKVMAAGTYHVDLSRLGGTVVIRGWNKAGVVTIPVAHNNGAESTPKLVFACGRGPCSLLRIWPGYSRPSLEFIIPKLDPREEASLAVIPLRRHAAE
jgi:hypothetical protein